MAQSGGLLRLPWNCSSGGCTIRSLILCSKLWVNKRISEIKKELFRQWLDSAKKFSYSLIFFRGQNLNLWASPNYVSHSIFTLVKAHLYFSFGKGVMRTPSRLVQCANAAGLDVCWSWRFCSSVVTVTGWLNLTCRLWAWAVHVHWICAYTARFKRIFIMLMNYSEMRFSGFSWLLTNFTCRIKFWLRIIVKEIALIKQRKLK